MSSRRLPKAPQSFSSAITKRTLRLVQSSFEVSVDTSKAIVTFRRSNYLDVLGRMHMYDKWPVLTANVVFILPAVLRE